MRLVSIYYWAGDTQRAVLAIPIEISQDGRLTCLKSDQLSNADIKKLKTIKLDGMNANELKEYLSKSLQSYHQALAEFKKGRYQIVKEYDV